VDGLQKMIKDLFLLDPLVIFLNHGSFGACPRPVFESYQDWQRRLERQPVHFLGVELDDYLFKARQVLAEFFHTSVDDLVYVPNATFGVNIVAQSLDLNPGDEILSTDQEYGACDLTWKFVCQRSGAAYRQQPIALPVKSSQEIVHQLWQGVTPHTRVIFLSHITSPTALTLPVRLICERARAAGILTVIDGAHAPGQIDLSHSARFLYW
jgi:isopenicillin-N epimerase